MSGTIRCDPLFMGSCDNITVVTVVGLDDEGAKNTCEISRELAEQGNTVLVIGFDDNVVRILFAKYVKDDPPVEGRRSKTMKDFDDYLNSVLPSGAYGSLLDASARLRATDGIECMNNVYPFMAEPSIFVCRTGDPTNTLDNFTNQAMPIYNGVMKMNSVGWVLHSIIDAAKACNANYVVLDASGSHLSIGQVCTMHSDIFFISFKDTMICRSAMERYSTLFAESYKKYFGTWSCSGWRQQSRGWRMWGKTAADDVRYPLPDKKPILAGLILNGQCATWGTLEVARELVGVFHRAGFGYRLGTPDSFHADTKNRVDTITSFRQDNGCNMIFNMDRENLFSTDERGLVHDASGWFVIIESSDRGAKSGEVGVRHGNEDHSVCEQLEDECGGGSTEPPPKKARS
jgi:hypothetical protein